MSSLDIDTMINTTNRLQADLELSEISPHSNPNFNPPISSNFSETQKFSLITSTRAISSSYSKILKLETLIFKNEKALLSIKNLQNDITKAEKQLSYINSKIEKTKEKYEEKIATIENNEVELGLGRSELMELQREQSQFMRGAFAKECLGQVGVRKKQLHLSNEFSHIFPTNASLYQFLGVKIPLKMELTIHQAFATGVGTIGESNKGSTSSPVSSKVKKSSKIDDLMLTSFVGENLVKLLLAESFINDVILRYPAMTLANNHFSTAPESGAVVRDYNERNVKLSSYSRRDRAEFLNGMAMLHCNFFDIEWVAKNKQNARVLTKGHSKNLWKIVESSMDRIANPLDLLTASSPSSLSGSPLRSSLISSEQRVQAQAEMKLQGQSQSQSQTSQTPQTPHLHSQIPAQSQPEIETDHEPSESDHLDRLLRSTISSKSTTHNSKATVLDHNQNLTPVSSLGVSAVGGGNRKNRLVDRSKLFG